MSKGTLVKLNTVSLKPEGEAKAEANRLELIGQLHGIPEGTGEGLVFELEDGETIRGLKMRITSAKKQAGDLDDLTAAEDEEGNLVVFRKQKRASKRRNGREAEELAAV